MARPALPSPDNRPVFILEKKQKKACAMAGLFRIKKHHVVYLFDAGRKPNKINNTAPTVIPQSATLNVG